MQTFRMMIIPFLALGLSACTTVSDRFGFFKDESKSYRKVTEAEQPMVIPQNLSASGMQNYYEVPGEDAGQPNEEPSLLPPGSSLRENKPAILEAKIRNAENAKIQGHTTMGQSSNRPLSSNLNFNQTWSKVGSILQSANYKIVEQDNALGTYFVIDTRNSGGKVKKDMPIYQVHVKAAGNAARVSVTPANPALQNFIARNLRN